MKRAKFYCENCRREVRWDAKVCPHCGRFFSAVKCPSCGFTGKSELFITGCPSCGYAGAGLVGTEGAIRADGPNVEAYSLDQVLDRSSESGRPQRRVPRWVYPLATGILLTALVVLILLYANLSG